MTKAISASHRMESSYAFFSRPFLRLQKVTWRFVVFSILLISIFPLPISSHNSSFCKQSMVIIRTICRSSTSVEGLLEGGNDVLMVVIMVSSSCELFTWWNTIKLDLQVNLRSFYIMHISNVYYWCRWSHYVGRMVIIIRTICRSSLIFHPTPVYLKGEILAEKKDTKKLQQFKVRGS